MAELESKLQDAGAPIFPGKIPQAPPMPKKIGEINWPPPPIKMSQEQAEARNLVLNEIKALQLNRQNSFRRILKMPIWSEKGK